MINKLKNIFKDKAYRGCEEWEINYEELKRKVKNGAILLDVRSIQEYNEGHLIGAIHIADYDIPVKHNLVLPDLERDIIVYCQNGGRSKKAYKSLKKLGYKNVYNLCGGLDSLY